MTPNPPDPELRRQGPELLAQAQTMLARQRGQG
jgi:hypothetical protein